MKKKFNKISDKNFKLNLFGKYKKIKKFNGLKYLDTLENY